MSSVYTRTGDKGQTSLLGGQRVSKHAPRLEAYGTVDELNAFIGLIRAHIKDRLVQPNVEGLADELDKYLRTVQNQLFVIGSHLACANEKDREKLPLLNSSHVNDLERSVDRLSANLPPLKEFVLPSGDPIGAEIHIARTICRRSERSIVLLNESEPVEPLVIQYLNRLSDFLFILARHANHQQGVSEEKWEK